MCGGDSYESDACESDGCKNDVCKSDVCESDVGGEAERGVFEWLAFTSESESRRWRVCAILRQSLGRK